MIGLRGLLSSAIRRLRVEEIRWSIKYCTLIANSIVLCSVFSDIVPIWIHAYFYSPQPISRTHWVSQIIRKVIFIALSISRRVVTFAFFAVIAKAKNSPGLMTAQAFTSLTALSLIGMPLLMLVQTVPQFMAAVGSFARIQQFLLSETREDRRWLPFSGTIHDGSTSRSSSIGLIQFQTSQSNKDLAVSITNGAFGWSRNKQSHSGKC